MRQYATLCSGIEGFGAGFDSAGLECVFQCEADPQCQQVLARHYPNVERTKDVNDQATADALCRLRPDVVAFGSPCQDLSVAGRRAGLAGERSGLFFRCVELCFACEAGWVVFENVPGIFSSNRGKDFAAVLEAFTGFAPSVPAEGWRNTGVCVGPLYTVAWAVLDSQWFGVPQRRRRVFVVGCLRDRGLAYQILSLGDSLPWDSPPSREARTRVAASLTAGVSSGSGINRPGRRREDDYNVVAFAQNQRDEIRDLNNLAGACAAEPGMKQLRAEGHDASEDGTGRGVPLVAHALTATATATGRLDPNGETFIPVGTLQAHNARHGHAMTTQQAAESGQLVPMAFDERNVTSKANRSDPINARELAQPQTTRNGGVRRLTPRECERLQGFEDDWTRYAADGTELSDSARYRMLGNAVNRNVAEWIGRRIIASTPKPDAKGA